MEPRDRQRSAVYGWEREYWGEDFWRVSLTLAECDALIAKVWNDYGRRNPPTVKDGRGTRIARGGWAYINLPRWSRTKPVVLHEIAHALLSPLLVEGHGPEFATLCLQLWERYAGADKKELRRAGIEKRPRRVYFAPVHEVDKLTGRARMLKRKSQ